MREEVIHNVKCHDIAFEIKWQGKKPWEFRLDDRNYQVGDIINEKEYLPLLQKYTHREIKERIVYKLSKGFGIPEGYCIMTTEEISRTNAI